MIRDIINDRFQKFFTMFYDLFKSHCLIYLLLLDKWIPSGLIDSILHKFVCESNDIIRQFMGDYPVVVYQ